MDYTMKRNTCLMLICAAAFLLTFTPKASAQVVYNNNTVIYPQTGANYYSGTTVYAPAYGVYGGRRYGYGTYGRTTVANRAYFGASRTGYGGTYRTGYGARGVGRGFRH